MTNIHPEYRQLYIIGNGFDRHYGVQSSYKHFSEYLRRTSPGLHDHLETVFQGDLWMDFEKALGEIALGDLFDNIFGFFGEYEDDPYKLEKDLVAWDCQQETVQSILNYPRLEELFTSWVESIVLPSEGFGDELIRDDDSMLYLSFNYIETLEIGFGVDPNRIHYIHGKRNTSDVLVIGHEPINVEQPSMARQWHAKDEIESTWIHFLKQSEKQTSAIINWSRSFFEKLSSIESVIVIGLSCADVDLPYIRKVKESVSDSCSWSYYQYNQPSGQAMEKRTAGIIDNWKVLYYPNSHS